MLTFPRRHFIVNLIKSEKTAKLPTICYLPLIFLFFCLHRVLCLSLKKLTSLRQTYWHLAVCQTHDTAMCFKDRSGQTQTPQSLLSFFLNSEILSNMIIQWIVEAIGNVVIPSFPISSLFTIFSSKMLQSKSYIKFLLICFVHGIVL